MMPSPTTLLARLRLCRQDLLTVGIDLDSHDPAQLRGLIRLHLDYFQLMLGHDVTSHAILRLVRLSAPRTRDPVPPTTRASKASRGTTHGTTRSVAPRRRRGAVRKSESVMTQVRRQVSSFRATDDHSGDVCTIYVFQTFAVSHLFEGVIEKPGRRALELADGSPVCTDVKGEYKTVHGGRRFTSDDPNAA